MSPNLEILPRRAARFPIRRVPAVVSALAATLVLSVLVPAIPDVPAILMVPQARAEGPRTPSETAPATTPATTPATASATVPATTPAAGSGTEPAAEVAERPLDAAAVLRIERSTSPIKIDGIVDEPAWKSAARISLDFEIMPGENVPSPVETECRITYDEENLYVSFVAHDPHPEQICARLSDRDPGSGDDQVGFMIDTFNDGRRAFEFFINPLGVQSDFFRNDLVLDNPEDGSWDAIWNSAGRLTPDGYVVEVAVPFNALRFPSADGDQTWGLVTFRNYPRSQRHQISNMRYDRSRGCDVCQYPKVIGFAGIRPGRSLEFDPTVTARRHDILGPGAGAAAGAAPSRNWNNGPVKSDIGLTTRWAITPGLILNATGNPDFSQVEADVAQLNVNARYALFYNERRPFFMEGADFFATPLQAVYTRTVADPDWGAKLTGKQGKNAVGLFVTRDTQNNLYFPSNEGTSFGSMPGNVTSGVMRYRRDVGSGGVLGGLATIRESGGYSNRLYGGDGRLRFAGSEMLQFQALGSSTRYPAGVAGEHGQPSGIRSDFGGKVEYDHTTRDWNWTASYQDLGPDFRADAGYIPRVDIRDAVGGITYTRWGQAGATISEAQIGADLERTADHGGTVTDQLVALRGFVAGPLQIVLQPRFERKMERFAGVNHDLDWGLLRFNARPSRPLTLWGVVAGGDGIDYENARKARRLWGGPGFSYDFGRHLEFFIDHTYEILSLGGQRIYNANLIQGRTVYQFNPRAFVRLVAQLTDVDYNPRMYPPGDAVNPGKPYGQTELFLQLLGSYKVNPQTVFYLGYSDQRLGTHPPDVRPVDRTFFLKLGYAWMV